MVMGFPPGSVEIFCTGQTRNDCWMRSCCGRSNDLEWQEIVIEKLFLADHLSDLIPAIVTEAE